MSAPDELGFAAIGEWLRRAALLATTALMVARAYYPSEDAGDGTGLWWVFSLLIVLGFAIAVQLLSGRSLVRFSLVDAFVIGLVGLVAASTPRGLEQRVAITMAWEWAGLGVLYLLARNLTRSKAEASTLAGAWVATAVAVAAYGLFQVGVELPVLQDAFRANPERMMRLQGYEPGTPAADLFTRRVLDSKEPFSTFGGLANSLAGFLVGPLVLVLAMAIENLRREAKGSRFIAFLLAALPSLALAVCLMLTKSRSAWIGGLVAAGLLVIRAWARVSRKSLVIALTLGGVGLAGLIAVGFATRQLDRQVLTESSKSLQYRLEYWAGTWAMLNNQPSEFAPKLSKAMAAQGGLEPEAPEVETRPEARAFWEGVGPGNFPGPYLRHKLAQASEEIKDPHNMVLEVWSTSGLPAAILLVLAVGWGGATILRPVRGEASESREPVEGGGKAWIVIGGLAGWLLVAFAGKLDPFDVREALLARWLVLGAAWGLTMALGAPLWRRVSLPAAGLGLAVVAISVNLLAAGGIGIPTVAIGLWLPLALGLSLRDDLGVGRLREVPGLGLVVALAVGWAALIGAFYGSVAPYWKSEAAMRRGDAEAMRKPPSYDRAREAYLAAASADRFNPQPWVRLANLEYQFWLSPEAATLPNHWMVVFQMLDKAVQPPLRNPDSLPVRRIQADIARDALKRLPKPTPGDLLMLRTQIARATRSAARLYPTSADIRAQVAYASADLGMFDDAIQEAEIALKLDGLTPHADKKLGDRLRRQLQSSIGTWEEARKSAAAIRDKGKDAKKP